MSNTANATNNYVIHELKTWPAPFEGVRLNIKTLELRYNDRDFLPGHILHLQEWDPDTCKYTGNSVYRTITYIMYGGQFGLADGWVAMSIVPGPIPSRFKVNA